MLKIVESMKAKLELFLEFTTKQEALVTKVYAANRS